MVHWGQSTAQFIIMMRGTADDGEQRITNLLLLDAVRICHSAELARSMF